MQSILSSALSELKNLTGQPTDIILANADGTGQLSTYELATGVSGLITTVVSPLGSLGSTVGLDVVGGLLTGVLGVVLYVFCAIYGGTCVYLGF